MLASLAKPSEGRVLFGDKDLHQDAAAAKAAVGFLSHATFLYGDLTARENLKFIGRLFGLADLNRRIDAALDLFEVGERSTAPVRELSRGLQQRVALARAFLHDPDYLLLDEPFTGLDARTLANLASLLSHLPEQGKGLVFSTHDFLQGASIARRLVALDKGRVRFDGALTAAPLEALGIPVRRA
jgi:heme exporter protein A